MTASMPSNLLANNEIILNIVESCQINNADWIKSCKIMREVTLSTSGAKELINFAVKRHLQNIHFDSGWYEFEDSVVKFQSSQNDGFFS